MKHAKSRRASARRRAPMSRVYRFLAETRGFYDGDRPPHPTWCLVYLILLMGREQTIAALRQ